MEASRFKQLQLVFQDVGDITGESIVVFSFLNKSTGAFEVKFIEGVSIAKIQTAKKAVQRFIKDFNPVNFSFTIQDNPVLEKLLSEKKFVSTDLHQATRNLLPKDAADSVLALFPIVQVTTFPVVINEAVLGLISFVSNNKIETHKLKAMTAFTNHVTLFLENILVNENLIMEVRDKTVRLEEEKNNLENNVRERTIKLDNSRSALLYMLKDIDKASKKLSSAKEYTDNIIHSMIETLIVIDTKGVIQTVNKATCDLLGYAEAELIGKHFASIFPGNDAVKVESLIADLIENGFVTNIEQTYITTDGIHIPVIFSGSVMREADDVVQGIVCVASDITIRKKHEREVQEQNMMIERTNLELKEALRKAEESDKLKTAFLQNMSHEIRTPLNGIVGFSQLLSSKNFPEANKLEIAKLVERSSFRLIELVNNILDIAKIETGQVKINSTAFMLNAFMKEIMAFFELFAREKKLTLSYDNFLDDDQSIIFLDKEKLHQIMVNLINNAIKFTKEGGIHFGYVIKNGEIEFFVRDTGMGIPKDLQERVFDRFTQADVALTRNYEGSGLGLSICKGLTELLGGRMWLESTPGQETIFYFTMPFFPANRSSDHEDAGLVDLEIISHSIHILVVEDDDVNYKFLDYLFLNSKHRITRAVNGQEAVDMVTGPDVFDIILMDLKMPVMSGFDATRIIKSKFPKIPIIALTAYAFEEDRQKAFTAGCDDFIQKAYRKETLFEKIIKFVPI